MPLVKILSGFDIEVCRKRVLHRIGYKSKDLRKKTPLHKAFLEAESLLSTLLNPAAVFSILDGMETNRHPVFEGAEKTALCVCTIGPELESAVNSLLKKNEMLISLVLDGCGSEAVDVLARRCSGLIAREAERMGYRTGKRLTPGHKKRPLEQQVFIFDNVPAERIGVCLSKNCMMFPMKSTSFRINLYK